MAADDMRYYETFYGIHQNDWAESFGSFANVQKILSKNYISSGAITTDFSSAHETHEFLYPHHIKKTYFIEGVIKGHITYESSQCTGYLCRYRVSVCKMHEDGTPTELFSTGWKTVCHTLGWDAVNGVPSSIEGEEGSIVFPFTIDAWEAAELSEYERIYLKVESTCTDSSSCVSCLDSTCSPCVKLWHSNDATWEDIKVEIPFRL